MNLKMIKVERPTKTLSISSLKSKPCAEHLTVEWMDVARYADSYGYQTDRGRQVWPYRDWILKAFDQNLPYDQFIRHQLPVI